MQSENEVKAPTPTSSTTSIATTTTTTSTSKMTTTQDSNENSNKDSQMSSSMIKEAVSMALRQFDLKDVFTVKKPSPNEHDNESKSTSKHIKRPMNAFMVWAQAARRALSKTHPTLHNAQLSKTLGNMWHQLSDEQKLPFIDEANRLRDEHKQAHPGYKYQPKRRSKLVSSSAMFKISEEHLKNLSNINLDKKFKKEITKKKQRSHPFISTLTANMNSSTSSNNTNNQNLNNSSNNNNNSNSTTSSPMTSNSVNMQTNSAGSNNHITNQSSNKFEQFTQRYDILPNSLAANQNSVSMTNPETYKSEPTCGNDSKSSGDFNSSYADDESFSKSNELCNNSNNSILNNLSKRDEQLLATSTRPNLNQYFNSYLNSQNYQATNNNILFPNSNNGQAHSNFYHHPYHFNNPNQFDRSLKTSEPIYQLQDFKTHQLAPNRSLPTLQASLSNSNQNASNNHNNYNQQHHQQQQQPTQQSHPNASYFYCQHNMNMKQHSIGSSSSPSPHSTNQSLNETNGRSANNTPEIGMANDLSATSSSSCSSSMLSSQSFLSSSNSPLISTPNTNNLNNIYNNDTNKYYQNLNHNNYYNPIMASFYPTAN